MISQWHPEKNGTMSPDNVSYGSQKKIWWICEHGHEWQSPPFSRLGKGSGCPYCAGKKVAPGMDLKSVYPELASQWHSCKNGKLRSEDILPGSHRAVWWQCEHGHEWKASVKSRTEGTGCPVCSNRSIVSGVNDLQTLEPELAKEWHPVKNGGLKPSQVGCGTTRKVWWKCSKGHEWQADIHSRVVGRDCPVCSGKVVVVGENDLATLYPDIVKEWHPTKNGKLTAQKVSAYSNRKVWWRCEKGHEWQSVISARTAGSAGCPYCAGRKVLQGFNDLKTLQPLVAAEWHPEKNGILQPTMVTVGSNKRVWWRCSLGHEWKAVIYSRTGARKCGCPVCAGKPARHY